MERKDIIGKEIEKHVLSLLPCSKNLDLGGFVIQNLRVAVHRGLYDNGLLYALHTLIPAESVKEETHTFATKWPADWKEAFKEAHFPEWLKKKYPVKYKRVKEKVKFTAYNLYPKWPAMMPDRCADAIQHIVKYREEWEEELSL